MTILSGEAFNYACVRTLQRRCKQGCNYTKLNSLSLSLLAPKPYLLFANDFDIREVSLNGDDYKAVLSIWTSIVALAVDTRDHMVYWADNFSKTISRAPIGNPLKVDVILKTDIQFLRGLDIDWIGRKLYWTDSCKILLIICIKITLREFLSSDVIFS